MEFDRTLVSENELLGINECMQKHGYSAKDFRFSTQRIHGYENGVLHPKAIVYVCRLSSNIEVSYELGNGDKFSSKFCIDLQTGKYDLN